jgi:hypothetical protein
MGSDLGQQRREHAVSEPDRHVLVRPHELHCGASVGVPRRRVQVETAVIAEAVKREHVRLRTKAGAVRCRVGRARFCRNEGLTRERVQEYPTKRGCVRGVCACVFVCVCVCVGV